MEKYLKEVTNREEFEKQKTVWLRDMSESKDLKESAIATLTLLERQRYTYQWNWLGVPIIKMPEEIILIQHAVYQYKPTAIIEIGVARGGGIVLYQSLQVLCGIEPNVLGIDIKYFEHTKEDLAHLLNDGVTLFEGPSLSSGAINAIQKFVQGHSSIFVVIDGDHSHENVLGELEMLDKYLPAQSIVLVADTILEEIDQTGLERPWNKDRNPGTALRQFLAEKSNWEHLTDFCNRVVLNESPMGWIQKTH
jgi:cephalosporin hydroxylase